MTFGRYLGGTALLAVAVVPLVFAAVQMRRRWLPDCDGSVARLAEAVIALALLLAVAQAFGALGVFYAVPVAAGCGVFGVSAGALARPRASPSGPGRVPAPALSGRGSAPAIDRVGLVLAIGGAAAIVGQWGVGTVRSLDRGMYGSDTLRYHGPVAARFVQEHSITGLHFLINDPVTSFHPYNAELLHGLGILFMGSDVLSPILNLGWVALALLAAWCVGRPRGLGPATLLAVALVLASPALVQTQPGSDDNDIVALALVLASASLLLSAGSRRPTIAVAAVAGGLALATKLTAVALVVAMTVGLVAVTPRATRGRTAAAWLVPLVAAGGFWYARNLFAVGNPLPWFRIDLGPLSLPSPPQLQGLTVAHYATDSHIWRTVFLPGLHERFGTVWVAVAVLALAGMAASVLWGLTPRHRMLGVAALVGVAGYAVTPGTAAGPEGFPIFFSATARYLAPAFALGLALLAVVPQFERFARRWWVLVGLIALLGATLSNEGVRPFDARRIGVAVACAVILGALATLRLRRAVPLRAPLATGLAFLALFGVLAGWRTTHHYLRDRYVRGSLSWANDLEDARIGLVGSMLQYHLYGRDLTNFVQYLGRKGPHGAFSAIRSCSGWRRALNAGHYRYVVTTPSNELFGKFRDRRPPEERWTSSSRMATELLRQPGHVTVFRLDGRLAPDGCAHRGRT